jgi:hypothetical protein
MKFLNLWDQKVPSGRRMRLPGPQAADAVDHCQESNRSASKKACAKANDQRSVILIKSMDDSNHLQDAKAAKGDQRDAFIGLLAPDSQGLGYEERSIAEKGETEDDSDKILH